jgi:hypothetical protein
MFHHRARWVHLCRTAVVLLGLASWAVASATTYYIAPNGNDANNGTSQSSPWRTIDRVNQMAFQAQPGDQFLFQRGGEFRGRLILGSSGSPASQIVYGAYGSGPSPVINGTRLVTGWTVHSGNIWKAQVGEQVDQVYVNDVRQVLARWPNTGWKHNQQATPNSITSPDITQASGYFNGARAIVRSLASSFDTLRISSHVNSTVTFTSNMTNTNMGTQDWGFYIENKLDLLNAAGEWFYEASSGYLYFWAPGNVDPNTLAVEASTWWAGVECYWQRHHLTIQDLTFRKARNAGVRQDGADHVTVNNCTIEDTYYGIRSYGSNDVYTNNTIRRTYATGILLIDNNSTVEGNTMEQIAMVPGQGESAWGYHGIRGIGSGNVIRGNRLDYVGYTAIEVNNDHLVEKNVITHYNACLNDGGGINFDHSNGLVIQDNIIRDGLGGLEGSPTAVGPNEHLAMGIYFGNTSNVNVTVQRNTIASIPGTGINVDHTMNSSGFVVRNNVIFDTRVGLSISDYSNSFGPYAVFPYYVANYNGQFENNIVYGISKDQICLRFYNCYGAAPVDFGTFTNNRYFNPYNEMTIFLFSFQAGQYYYSLEHWQAERSEEQGSTASPLRLNDLATVSELSGNLVPNGDFSTGVAGWGGWPFNAQVTHDFSQLDNGCLKANLPDNSQYDDFSMRNPDFFNMNTGDWYRMDLSLKSNAPGRVLVAVKGQSQENDPYNRWERTVPFGPQRRDLSMYFQVPVGEPMKVLFRNNWTLPLYYLDNVSIRKVQVQQLDPLDRQIILVNDQPAEQTFPLEGCWSDVNGMLYTGSIAVPAYRSRVLVREADELCGLSTGVDAAASVAPAAGVYPNPVIAGGRLAFGAPVQGLVRLIAANGQVMLQRELAAGTFGMELPADLPAGVYAMAIDGHRTERLVVER